MGCQFLVVAFPGLWSERMIKGIDVIPRYCFREVDSPITVLTGLDYWLDNLMCNVPEIAMCYHQGGFVQVG